MAGGLLRAGLALILFVQCFRDSAATSVLEGAVSSQHEGNGLARRLLQQSTAAGGTLLLWTEASTRREYTVPGDLPSLSQFDVGDTYLVTLDNLGQAKVAYANPLITNGIAIPQDSLKSGVSQIAAGYNHAVAVKTDNSIVVWGDGNSLGTLNAPVLANTPDQRILGVTVGSQFTILRLANGSLISFGKNIGPVPTGRFRLVSAGADHAMALREDGSLVGWGTSPQAQVDPRAATNVKFVACGGSHTLALLNSGEVVAWGSNGFGQTQVPDSARSGVQAISAGDTHSMALLANGTVVSWGNPINLPQFNVPVKHIRAGGSLSAAYTGTLNTLVTSPPPPPPAPPSPPAPQRDTVVVIDNSSGGSSSNTGMIGGIVGAVGGVVLLALLAMLFLIRARKSRAAAAAAAYKHKDFDMDMYDGLDGDKLLSPKGAEVVKAPKEGLELPGLLAGDPFFDVAKQYKWITMAGRNTVPIEAGVNDTQLDSLSAASADKSCPVLRLSRAEVQEQLELLQEGMLGMGAAAVVFQARWPKRFGPEGILAVKILKDAYQAPEAVRDSFTYEAKLLAAIRHPNIVRVYGYCLELPTVCLVLELLPCSLGDVLYPDKRQANTNSTMPSNASFFGSLFGAGTPLPITPGDNRDTGFSNLVGIVSTPEATRMTDTTAPQQQDPSTAGNTTAGVTTTHGTTSEDAVAMVNVTAEDGAAKPPALSLDNTTTGMTTSMTTGPYPDALSPSSMGNTSHSVGQSSTSGVPFTPKPGAAAMSMLQALQVSADIAAGLAYLHSKCIATTATWSEELVEVKVLEEGAAPPPEGQAVGVVPEGDEAAAGAAEAAAMPLVSPGGTAQTQTQVSYIVHRDLKPANILLNSLGRAKISDFGLARQHDTTTVHTEHVGAGTLTYMAPELLDSRRQGALVMKPTNRVDIYSLGIMMWEMIARQKPFSGMTEVQLVMAVCSRRRPPIPRKKAIADDDDTGASSTAASDMPLTNLHLVPASFDALPPFTDVITACWAHRELKRPTASEVSNTLDGLLQQYVEAARAAQANAGPQEQQ